jgi:hypothetical protein
LSGRPLAPQPLKHCPSCREVFLVVFQDFGHAAVPLGLIFGLGGQDELGHCPIAAILVLLALETETARACYQYVEKLERKFRGTSLVSWSWKRHDVARVVLMILFPWTPFVSAMKTVLMVLLHWMALASVALAIYVVAGSWMFGEWWYGFFWGGKRNLQYITDGLRVLLDEHYRLAIATVAAILAAVVVSDTMLAHWLLPFTDRFGGLIVFTACMTILAAALVVRHTKGESYRRWQEVYSALDAVQKLTSATPPKIEPPICFHYLDNARVEALYNQIQPELEERERIVGGSRTFGGEAKGRVGGVNIEVGAGKAKESKSTLTRIDFSTDRKCIEIMKHVQETRPGNYYSSAVDWYFRRATKEISLSAASPATAQAGRGKELASSEDSRRKVERWHGELKRELESPNS